MPSSRKISSKKSSDEQQLVDGAQELAGLRALDDAVVVGGGQRDQLADAQFGDAFLAGALELGGVLQCARADDRALPAHQPRHRMHGADGARIRQRDRHAGVVLGGQLAVPGAPHDVLVGRENWPKRIVSARLIAGHHELPVAVLALQVDRQAQVDVRRGDRGRLAVHLGEVPVHVRELPDRLHDRVTDQVGERDLAAAGALEVVVDDDPVVDQQLRRNGPHAGRGRHLQRRVHVLDDGRGGAAQHPYLVAFPAPGRGSRLRLGGCVRGGFLLRGGSLAYRPGLGGRSGLGRLGRLRSGLRLGRCSRLGRLPIAGQRSGVGGRFRGVVDQEFMPARIDRGGVFAELAVHLLDQPLVLPER